jgi:hypothetical protein
MSNEILHGWNPIETAPENELCLFYTSAYGEGFWFTSRLYKGKTPVMAGKRATHWMPLTKPESES